MSKVAPTDPTVEAKRSGSVRGPNRIFAIILALAWPGAGHLYLGSPLRAFWALASVLIWFFAGALWLGRSFLGLGLLIAVAGVLRVVWATLVATHRNVRRRWYSRWFVILPLGITFSTVLPTVEPLLRYRMFRSTSAAMAPAIGYQDRLVVDQWAYRHEDPERGTVVTAVNPDGMLVVFRCVGVPGDSVVVTASDLSVNGSVVADWSAPLRVTPRQYTLAPDQYFLVGDNSEGSYDSRFWGPVDRDNVRGQARYLYWPPRRAGDRLAE